MNERLILSNQYRILAKIDEEGVEHYDHMREIMEHGITDLYHELTSSLMEEKSEETCRETHDILTMFRVISNTINGLSDEEKEGLNLEAIKFEGFDANNDDHYFIAKFFVEKAGLYEELPGQYLNSHTVISLVKYQRMHQAYRDAIEANGYQLDLSGLKKIIAVA